MVINRTPFRISFFGGGTDYPDWYNQHGGMVLSTSIDKYCYVTCRYLPPFFSYKHRIRYTAREEVNSVDEIQHASVRECLRYRGIDRGIEMQHNSDLPAMSGLGSSSSFSVGFLHSLYALEGKMVAKRRLALEAIDIEQNKIGENVGSQDQTIAAFGGFNKIVFGDPQELSVYPITADKDKLSRLQEHLMLFFTGFSREASLIAAEQIKNIPDKKKELKALGDIAEAAISDFCSSSSSLDNFGRFLDASWQIKRTLSSKITTSAIDQVYEATKAAGALGGKLLGAGGGGFMLIFARPQDQPRIHEKLKDLLHVPFKFDNSGSQIIFYSPDDQAKDIR